MPKFDEFEDLEKLPKPAEDEEVKKKTKKPTAVSEREIEEVIEEVEEKIPGSGPTPEEDLTHETPTPLEEEEVISDITTGRIDEDTEEDLGGEEEDIGGVEDKFDDFKEPPTTVSAPTPGEEEESLPPPPPPPPESTPTETKEGEEFPDKFEKIVEESYEEVVEEKAKPEFTFETMPKVMASGEVYYKPEEYYYWYLLTQEQYKKRGIPYTEKELKAVAMRKHQAYLEYKDLIESLSSYRIEDLEAELREKWKEFEGVKSEFFKSFEEAEGKLTKMREELDLTPEEIAFLRELKEKYGLLGRIHAMTPEERAKLESIVKGTLEKQGIEVTPEVLTANLLTVLGAYTQLLRSEELLKTRYEYGLKYLEDLEKQLKAYEEQVRKLEEWERGLGDITKIKQEVEKFLFSPPVITITPEEVRGKAIAKLTAVTEEDIKELVTHPQLAVREKEEYYTLLEKALEKYFPTKFPEDTLTGQMMKFAEKLPTGVREVVEFGAGVVAPFEEWREMGGWFGFEQPNVPTYTGGMISGFLAGSTEELRIATKRPAYTAGTIVGEFIQDYLLGKAIAKGLAKFFGWVESKVPKTPEGRWIVTHYPPITRRVLRGLEKLKNLLIEQKQIAKTIEEVRDIGVYRFDLEEGIEGISKSLIRIAEKDIGDIVEDLRLLKKGDIVGGELKEARKFIPEDIGKTPSFALRYEPTYERIDLGDIAEFTRRMEKLGAKEGIMFRAVEREGIRVPQLFDIRIGKKGLMVTRYTPTITFEKFPVKFIEEGTEEFLGRFKPEYIKIKPEDVEDFLKKPPEGASWDEWYKYYQKKLEIGKRKYAVKPPEVPEEIKLKPPEVEEDVFRTIKGRGATDVEGFTAVSVSEDMKQLLKVVQRTEGIEELTLRTPSILGITTRRTVRTPTLPLTLLIPRVGVKERELLLEVEEEKPKVEEKPVLDIKLEELGREFFIPVRIRYKPTLSFREISRSLGGFTRVPGVYTPSPKLFTPTAVKPTTRIRQAELTVPKLLELETTQTLPSLSTGVEEKIVPPIIPPLFLPGGAYPRKFGITRWRRWISEWFGFEPRILKAKSKTKTKGKRRRKSKKKGRKSKRRGRRK